MRTETEGLKYGALIGRQDTVEILRPVVHA